MSSDDWKAVGVLLVVVVAVLAFDLLITGRKK